MITYLTFCVLEENVPHMFETNQMNYRKWRKSAGLSFLSLSHLHLSLSAEMRWGSAGTVEVRAVFLGRTGCVLIDS